MPTLTTYFYAILPTVDQHSAVAVALQSPSRFLVVFGLQFFLGRSGAVYRRCLGCLPKTLRLWGSISIHWWLWWFAAVRMVLGLFTA